MTAGAACLFPASYSSLVGNGDDEEYAATAFSWVDQGAGDLIYFGSRRYKRLVSKPGLRM
jgi:hypothetical protein